MTGWHHLRPHSRTPSSAGDNPVTLAEVLRTCVAAFIYVGMMAMLRLGFNTAWHALFG